MDFLNRLKQRVHVLDGAMGTLLYSMGAAKGHCYDELCLSNPELISNIHDNYILAGSDIIKTNTYGANRAILGTYYDLGGRVGEINSRGAELARESVERSDREVFVAGSIGPVTRPLEGDMVFTDEELGEIFNEQAKALLEGGVDIFILETFGDSHEASIAFDSIKVHGRPVIVMHSFTQEGRTIFGIPPKDVAYDMMKIGAQISGVNCSIGPQNALDALKGMSAIYPHFLAVAPNAGRPKFIDGSFIYPATPEYFGIFARKALSNGANIIGGCCGTTFEHIEAIAQAVGGKEPRPHSVSVLNKRRVRRKPHIFENTRFLSKLKSDEEVITVEIDPPKGADIIQILEDVKYLEALGVDGLNIADMPLARLRMSALSLAGLIKTRTELDIILHLTARDRNIIGLQADLLGAHAFGIRDILALRGDPPSVGDYPFATGVFDVEARGIVSMVSHLNRGEDRLGNDLQSPTNISIGVAFNPGLPRLKRELDRLDDKISKGAHFVQTQPIFDAKTFLELDMPDIPVIASILPLRSLRNAVFLKNEVPGIYIPDKYIARMEKADNPYIEGARIAAEIMDNISDKVAGFCIIPPFGKHKVVEKISCFRSKTNT